MQSCLSSKGDVSASVQPSQTQALTLRAAPPPSREQKDAQPCIRGWVSPSLIRPLQGRTNRQCAAPSLRLANPILPVIRKHRNAVSRQDFCPAAPLIPAPRGEQRAGAVSRRNAGNANGMLEWTASEPAAGMALLPSVVSPAGP